MNPYHSDLTETVSDFVVIGSGRCFGIMHINLFKDISILLGITANPRLRPADYPLYEIATELGRQQTFRPTPVAIYFGDARYEVVYERTTGWFVKRRQSIRAHNVVTHAMAERPMSQIPAASEARPFRPRPALE